MTDTNSMTILYQMGKVGSTSVHDALIASELDSPVHKVHFLSDTGLAHSEKFHQKTLKNNAHWTTPYLDTTHHVRKRIASEPELKLNIVTLVREPVRRELSEFFQYVDALHPELVDQDGNLNTQRALRVIQARFMFYNEANNYTCRWFDTEVKEHFGLDVFAHPFDCERGYSLIEQGNIRLLVLRMEDIDRSLNSALRQLLGPAYKDWDSTARANTAKDKQSGSHYGELVNTIKLRGSTCQKVYASTYASHFYSDKERADLIAQWSQ